MRVLHIQLTGNPGGIASLTRDIARNSNEEHIMYFIFSGGSVAEKMQQEGIEVYVGESSHKYWGSSINKLLKICEEKKIDVIVNHQNSPISIAHAMAVKKKCKDTKYFMYFHSAAEDFFNNKKKKILYKPFIKWQMHVADHMIAISDYVKGSFIKELNIDEKKITVIYNGVDCKRFSYVSREKGEKLEIIYVGRLFSKKGVHVLVEAISTMKNKDKIHLRIVGGGPDEGYLKELTAKLGLEPMVELLGTRLDVPELLETAEFFVHPAIWNEGFGITLIEAMATGIPCIAFRKGAIPEIISDAVNGYIVDEASVEALAHKLDDCIEELSSTKYLELCEGARNTAESFDINRMISKLENLMK